MDSLYMSKKIKKHLQYSLIMNMTRIATVISNDGLHDGVEVAMYNDGARPDKKDIYAEVDWMGPEPHEWWEFWKCGGHTMSGEAKEKVIKAFWRHGIDLHIDDGWMGGGQEITHVDWIKFSMGYQWRDTDGDGILDTRFPHNQIDENGDGIFDAPGRQDDFYDFKYGEDNNFNGNLDAGEDWDNDGTIDTYFSYSRKDIFHYCLFTHETESWYKGQWHRTAGGWGEQPGNDIIVTKNALSQACVFMHELGHNLGLSDRSGNTAMQTPEPLFAVIDYLPEEWAIIDLKGVVGGD